MEELSIIMRFQMGKLDGGCSGCCLDKESKAVSTQRKVTMKVKE